METHQADVVIIGAGAVGISCAWFIAQKGLSVIVVDQNGIASGSSAGNAGLVGPRYFAPLAAPGVIAKGLKWMFDPESPFYIKPRFDLHLLRWLWAFRRAARPKPYQRGMDCLLGLNRESIALYREFAGSFKTGFDFSNNGILLLYNSESGYKDNQAMAETAREFGLNARHLDNQQLNQMEPALKLAASGGFYYQDNGHLTPMAFVTAMARELMEGPLDVKIVVNAGAVRIKRSGNHIAAVNAGERQFVAPNYVIAGGGWSAQIVREIGLRLSLEPAKGYSITIPVEKPPTATPLLLSEAKVAVTPLGKTLRLAGTLELAGTDLSINEKRVDAIRKSVPAYFRGLSDEQIKTGKIWSGLRPCSPDGLPYLGRFAGCPNLIAATGHGMIGMSLAPVSGKLVAQLVAGEQSEIDMTALSPDRY